MAELKKKKRQSATALWLNTYADMVTLVLTFFIMLITTAKMDGSEIKLVMAAFTGIGVMNGGNTLSVGKLAELGNTVGALPSTEMGRSLNQARKKAISEFEPEIKSNKIRVQLEERGLVITLMSDAFFEPGSARVEIEKSRQTLYKISRLLQAMPDRTFRVEGHTDTVPTDPNGPWKTNWELSTARSTNVLHYLLEFGGDNRDFEKQFQVAGFADTRPLDSADTEEGRSRNRRVDIVILADGNL